MSDINGIGNIGKINEIPVAHQQYAATKGAEEASIFDEVNKTPVDPVVDPTLDPSPVDPVVDPTVDPSPVDPVVDPVVDPTLDPSPVDPSPVGSTGNSGAKTPQSPKTSDSNNTEHKSFFGKMVQKTKDIINNVIDSLTDKTLPNEDIYDVRK